MPDYHIPLTPGETYHIFSRAIGSEKLFLSEENYQYFLLKLGQHVGPVAELYSYSLLPNHFHLLARIKQPDEIIPYYEFVKTRRYNLLENNLSDFIMERFSNWLNGYTKAFNKMNERKGSLFMDYLKRSHAKNDNDFTTFLWYVHKNAIHHGLTNQVGDWQHDAYKSLQSDAPTQLLRKEVLDWFGGRDAFIKFHHQPVALKETIWIDI